MGLGKLRRLLSLRSSKNYIDYLKKRGSSIGKETVFLSPVHTDFDIGRAPYISIGNNCIICSGVSIIAHDYSWKILEKSHSKLLPSGGMPIKIGNNVFIGVNSTILGNVEIGDNVIIAAGSVVCKSLPPNTVCAGNPAKVVKTLDDYYKKREASVLADAVSNAKFIYEKTGRAPTMEEMRNFIVLFMPRTDENFRKYVYSYNCVGGDVNDYAEMIRMTEPLYPDLETFLRKEVID
ncbi:MAG: acyltransferase [Clostridia bacterium]|nr:acyltransferase [Clostridia bacterium]